MTNSDEFDYAAEVGRLRAKRVEIAKQMRSDGASLRQIGQVLGVDASTVLRDTDEQTWRQRANADKRSRQRAVYERLGMDGTDVED